MNRMGRHLTASQAEAYERKYINESIGEDIKRSGVYQTDNIAHSLSTPEELITALTNDEISPKKSWFVTIGYIKGFDKLGNKKIGTSISKFDDDASVAARALNNDRLNTILDNPTIIDKGRNKGSISNPYMPSTGTNYIVEASIIRLMYGRNDAYAAQKDAVKRDLAQYMSDNPDDVKYYMTNHTDRYGHHLIDFVDQSYDDARADTTTKIPGTNAFQKADGTYGMRFNTPKGIFKKLKTQYFLITDENTVEPISKEEAEAYANLYGTIPTKTPETDAIIAKVKKDIEDIKLKNHKGDVWTNYDLDSVFFMNFAEGENSKNKLQYYNPDAIVEFVKEKESKKTGISPARRLASGVMKPHFDAFVGKNN